MKLVKQYSFLGSSQNPEKLSESIRGTLILVVPVIMRMSGVDMPEDTLIEFINNGFVFWGTCVVAFGLGRKLYFKALEIYKSVKE